MIKILLLLIATYSFAGFFDDFIPTPQKMLDFYNQNVPNMLPIFTREKRLEDQVVDSILGGDVVYLQTKDRKIFSIFMEAEDKAKAGIILFHTRGENPNEANLIKPLRINMAENNYHTLSVQMPVLNKDTTYYDYVPVFSHSHSRVKAAIDFYQKIGIKKIIIIAHGCGGHMAMSYIDKYGDNKINAFIGIGMGATDTGQTVIKQYPLATMQAPVLDIIAQYDYLSVKKHAKTRIPHLALGNKNNQQIKLKKAKHYHKSDKEFNNLTKTIYGWLDKINL